MKNIINNKNMDQIIQIHELLHVIFNSIDNPIDQIHALMITKNVYKFYDSYINKIYKVIDNKKIFELKFEYKISQIIIEIPNGGKNNLCINGKWFINPTTYFGNFYYYSNINIPYQSYINLTLPEKKYFISDIHNNGNILSTNINFIDKKTYVDATEKKNTSSFTTSYKTNMVRNKIICFFSSVRFII